MLQVIFYQIRLTSISICREITNAFAILRVRNVQFLLAFICLVSLNTLSLNAHAVSNINDDEITISTDETPSYQYPNAQSPLDYNAAGSTLNLPAPQLPLPPNENGDESYPSDESDADIWQRIKDGYAMPNAESSLVTRHENAFSAKPKVISNMVDRSQKYLFHIVEEVQNRGMPTEIALLPMIESAYNPKAYSGSKASGIWQFIPSTGKNYGLKQNWWVDNRRNITFATDAALSYLQKLHVMFGAWDLALAAYNAGEGTVRRAIEKNKKLGKPTNYESLDLPAETRNYVPKLQAIKNIMTHPANYGIKLKSIENKAYFTTVTAPAQIDAKLAAELAGVSDEEFIALNPSYNRPVLTTTGDTHELLLPISAAQTFQDNLAAYNKPLVSWKPYTAKPGELLAAIATKFDIGLDKLRNINQLSSQKKITKSTTILVPNGNNSALNAENNAQNLTQSSQIIDSDVDISQAQNSENIDISHLEKLQENNLIQEEDKTKNNKADIEPAMQTGLSHLVKNGDTLEKIAKKYGISAKTISALNHLKKNQVKVGQKLVIKPEIKNAKSVKIKSTKNNVDKLKPNKSKNTTKESKVKGNKNKSLKTASEKKKTKDNISTKNKQSSKITKPTTSKTKTVKDKPK